MARAYLSGIYFPKTCTTYWGDVWIRIKTRPNRTFRYYPLIHGLVDLNYKIEAESLNIKVNSDYATDDYDELVQIREELKENPVVIRAYKKVELDTIYLASETVSRYDAEVAIKSYLTKKGHDIRSIKWTRN
jgi:hypothetical protein